MKLLVIIGLAVLAFYIGKWTNDYWLAVGLFIGAYIAVVVTWPEDVAVMRHIDLDEEERITIIPSPPAKNKSLFNTMLCILGVAWLLGRGDDEDGS